MRCIVAVCGLKRSGKDVVARHIHERYGFKHVSIAQPLKNVVKTAFDLSDRELDSDSKDVVHPVWGVPPRILLDYIGTHVFQHDIGRVVPSLKDRCFWIDRLLSSNELEAKLVISDLRFEHELERLRAFSEQHACRLTVIRVTRNGTSTNGLASEMESERLDANHVIDNNGSLSDLYQKISHVMLKNVQHVQNVDIKQPVPTGY